MLRRMFIALTASTLLAAPAFADGHTKDIVDTAVGAGSFTTLVAAVQAAGLVDTLNGDGPFTVFAPTNDAFKAVPQKTLDELAANPAQLKSVLAYHVLPAKVVAADVKTGNAKTVQGANLALSKAGTFVTVEEAMVEKADIAATNGVVHTIDRVLLPPVRR